MKWTIPIAFLLISAAACTTLAFVRALEPASTGAFMFFAAWLIFPYAVMSVALVLMQRKGAASLGYLIVAVIVSTGGIVFLANAIFWHPDAQGAIAVLMTPILQGGLLTLLLPVAWRLSRNART